MQPPDDAEAALSDAPASAWRIQRLSSKFLLLTVPAVVLSALLFLGAAYLQESSNRRAQNITIVTQDARQDASLLVHPVWNVDRPTISSLLDSIATQNRVRCVRLRAPGVAPSERGDCAAAGDSHVLTTPIDYATPSGNRTIGELEHWFDVTPDRGGVLRDLQPLLLQLLILLLVLVLSSVLAFRWTVLVPLNRVGASLRTFQERGERTPVDSDARDELGEFIREYNAGLVRQEIAEQNLQDQLSFQMALHNTMPTPFAFLDRELRLIDANPAFHAQLGIGEDALRRPLPDVLPGVDWERIRTMPAGAVHTQELVGLEVDSEERGFSLACSPFLGSANALLGYVLVMQDITSRIVYEHSLRAAQTQAERALHDLRRMQESLVQSEKLAALGSLVAGVAHEVNTPLGNALTIASHLEEKVTTLHRAFAEENLKRSELAAFIGGAREACAILGRSLTRAADQIARFKQVAVDQASSKRRRFQLDRVLDDVLSTHRPQLKHTPHTMEVEVPAGIELDSYPGPLEQVVSNCFNNAMLHGFDGVAAGTIRISAEPIDEDHIRLTIADNGRGIHPDHIKHVFDPFFTTKLGTGGSGLGMNLVYNIVTGALGGTVRVQSEPGVGTQVIIEMPRTAPAQGEVRNPHIPTQVARNDKQTASLG